MVSIDFYKDIRWSIPQSSHNLPTQDFAARAVELSAMGSWDDPQCFVGKLTVISMAMASIANCYPLVMTNVTMENGPFIVLVGGLEHSFFFHILGIIIPSD